MLVTDGENISAAHPHFRPLFSPCLRCMELKYIHEEEAILQCQDCTIPKERVGSALSVQEARSSWGFVLTSDGSYTLSFQQVCLISAVGRDI